MSALGVRGLFEAHLTVTDLARSVAFYRDVVGLSLAFEAPERGAAFLWAGDRGTSMLGLWSLDSVPVGLTLHVAFAAPLDEDEDAAGVEPEAPPKCGTSVTICRA